jgi:hypothetical protein
MKKILMTLMTGILAASMLVIGCKKNEESSAKLEGNGLTKEINNLVPEEIRNEMTALGMPINTGENPPSLENIYLASPFILKASNRPSDAIGMTFTDYKIKYYEQNNDNLTVKSDYVNGPETGTGLGSYIVGNNNTFTTFSEVSSTYQGENAKLVHVISGTLVAEGIQDLYFANFMLDNNGNPNGIWIENGEGRVIYDSDGMSEIVSSLKLSNLENSHTDIQTVSTVNK